MRLIERRSSWRNDLMGDDRTVSAERRGDHGVLAICDLVKSVECLCTVCTVRMNCVYYHPIHLIPNHLSLDSTPRRGHDAEVFRSDTWGMTRELDPLDI